MESTSDLILRFLQEAPTPPLSFTKKDMAHIYDQIRSKTGHALPKELELLYSRFEFPAFNVDPITFFGNLDPKSYEGDGFYNDSEHIMNKWLNEDFTAAIGNGFLPFASYMGTYDPVCFDTNRKGLPLVALYHEAILMYEEINVIAEIAPSLKHFLEESLSSSKG